MFERFTDRARRVVVSAQEEARQLWHNYIGTEHLLLGLIREPTDIAARALTNLGVSTDRVRAEVEEVVGHGEEAPSGHIPFTPRAKKALEISLREAQQLKHRHIGTEHILLGLLREGDGVAAQVLLRLGADLTKVRREVLRLAGDADADEPAGATPAHQRPHTPAVREVLAAAEYLAGDAPMGSHHLLEALVRSHGSAAAHALSVTGVDVEVLAANLGQVALEGTTDITPEEEAARQMEIRIVDDEVHVVLRDAATVEHVRDLSGQLGGAIRGTDPMASGLAGLQQAVARYLDRLQHRLAQPEEADPDSAGGTGVSAIVRRAMHGRLRRRAR